MRKLTVSMAIALPLAIGGCKADEAPKAPPAPAQATPPASQPAHAASQPGHAASQPAGAASNPHSDGKPKPPPGAPFSGLVKLGEGLGPDDVKPTDVLFIMARESQGGGLAGRLVAVQRHGKVEFPKRYEMTSSDVMVPGIVFSGPFIVLARLDRDGDPMTRGEDDLYATVATPVSPGQQGVHLVLKRGAPKTMAAPAGVRAPTANPSAPSGAASRPASRPAGR